MRLRIFIQKNTTKKGALKQKRFAILLAGEIFYQPSRSFSLPESHGIHDSVEKTLILPALAYVVVVIMHHYWFR